MNKPLRKLFVLGLALATTFIPANTLTKVSSTTGIANAQNSWAAQPQVKVKRSSTSGPVGLTPAQLKKAYGLDQISATGAGKTIAIVDAYGSPTMQNDLTTFNNQFGLPQANLTIVYPSGKPGKTDGGWALETAMDVEWAHVIAPSANILLCVAKSASISDLLAAEDYATSLGVQVVSNSWGGSEFSGETTYDSHFQHSGITYVASTGDNGSGVGWPAVSPNVLAVGGTTLNIDSTGTYQSESGWTGSGGGTSVYQTEPNYQNNWTSIVGSHRGNPDISFDADPNTGVAVYDSTRDNGQVGWFQVGGTSLGAPCWAAMVALFDQNRTNAYTSFDVMTQLYNLAGTAGSSGYSTNYHDIIQGSNGGYNAQSGYDMVTGIGSPKANYLVPYMTTAP
ncbi:S53 family peptidase [Candidatus Clostridium radicumherbarum]|uniref:Peptidase S53 domain-containing protein n=1 Tax=Candidatus Clostridium radicumherbarum TaxID=3381662 RepID=A0ABW8TUZ7_9CLOT